MELSVGIVDYGMGNLTSVRNALLAMNCPAAILADPMEAAMASHIILPGVGAFGDAMCNLRDRGWVECLEREVRENGKPFLGICLGQQLLAAIGTEHGEHAGLGWIDGSVVRLNDNQGTTRIPHVGWNDVVVEHANGCYRGFEKPGVFYFVHSFVLQPTDSAVVDGWCDYDQRFVASLCRENIWAVQFHPEKSQKDGLRVLHNFVHHCPRR